LREEASRQIELLIGLLDATEDVDEDSACDDEPIDDIGDAEPSLAAPENHPDINRTRNCSQVRWNQGEPDERESDHCDDEPSP
jgi:hypothetical protein